jgi:hypothetical protein
LLAAPTTVIKGLWVLAWIMLAAPTHDRLVRTLRYMLDENEFLSSYGLRSVSRVHRNKPYVFGAGHEEHRVDYVPGEGTSYLLAATPLARPHLVSDQLPQHRSTRALPPFLRQ